MTGLCLALTFGTLLSSQGADAHQSEGLSAILWGNPLTVPPAPGTVNSHNRLVM